MRVVVRSQENSCPCTSEKALGNISDILEQLRLARHGAMYKEGSPAEQEQTAWDSVRYQAESIPDLLREVDQACRTNTIGGNEEFQRAIRAKSFGDLVEAIAGIRLRFCNIVLPPGGVQIPFSRLEEAARRTEEEERQSLR
jgi:hypothetical protein